MDASLDKLVRITFLAGIAYWSFLLIHPLLGILIWGLILAVALYPLFDWLCFRLGNHRYIAALIITILTLFAIVSLLALLTNNLIDNVRVLSSSISSGGQLLMDPPASVKEWPIIGDQLYDFWSSLNENLGSVINDYSDNIITAGSHILAKTANKGFELILFIISVIFSGYLMTQSDKLMKYLRLFAERIAHERASNLIAIMKETIQNVSRGVIGISLLQTMFFAIILLVANTPGAGLLSFLGLMLCIVQIGLFVLVLPIIIWLFAVKSFAMALTLSILLILITFIDNVLKPLVFSRGLSTPMLVIFLGVIGGILTHGLVGIFIGPVILALFYDITRHWLLAKK